jgi:pimeloyl-ACP methyl ester carboxylesterase
MRMRSRVPQLAAVLLAGGALAGAHAAPAPAAPAVSFAPCPGQASLGCATVAVPLDRTGRVPGTVSLAVRRRLAGAVPSTDAVVGLAGGPGQAALPLTTDIARVIAPALTTRDLIVFDQRGTGNSNALDCPALSQNGAADTLAALCAQQLGAARGSFTTADSVADLEAIRQAAGYDRLVLFGVSYGTKVALEYAERYPQHVERLVLDSVVDVNGPDPFERSTFAATARVLGDLCAQGACAGVTADPTADIAALVTRLRVSQAPLRGHVYDGTGRRVSLSLGRGDLLQILVSGDENPALRALLPAAVHSALNHDAAPLLRLALLAAGLTPDAERGPVNDGELHRALSTARQATGAGAFDQALNVTTTCEELAFPWARNASPADRLNQAAHQAAALSGSQVAPFDQLTALLGGPIPLCLQWPDASPAPPAPAALPAVPTLVVSGAADLRTPTEDARRVAAEIPGSQLFVAANTGHSVLGSDLSGCAPGAVAAFFSDAAPPPCTPRANPFRPTPVPPTRLAAVRPLPGAAGRTGRTLAAVQDALVDLRRQIVGAAIGLGRSVPVGARFGGLRGGRALVMHGLLRLQALTYVPGVSVSGTVPDGVLLGTGGGVARLQIGGSATARGSLRLSGGRASGTLGGHGVDLTLAVAAQASSTPTVPVPAAPRLARVG